MNAIWKPALQIRIRHILFDPDIWDIYRDNPQTNTPGMSDERAILSDSTLRAVSPASAAVERNLHQAQVLLSNQNVKEGFEQARPHLLQAIAESRPLIASWKENVERLLRAQRQLAGRTKSMLSRPLPGSRRYAQALKWESMIEQCMRHNTLPFLAQATYAKALLDAGHLTSATNEWKKALRWSDIVDVTSIKREIRRMEKVLTERLTADRRAHLQNYLAELQEVLHLREHMQDEYAFLTLDHRTFMLVVDRILMNIHKGRRWWFTQELLDRAIINPAFKKEQALVLIALRVHFNEVRKLFNTSPYPGRLVRKDIIRFCNAWKSVTTAETEVQQLVYQLEQTIEQARRRILFAKTSGAAQMPDTLIEAKSGSCYFLSALASLCVLDPERASNLVKRTDSGAFSVHFPGMNGRSIATPALSDAELAMPGNAHTSPWLCALEKAYIDLCSQQLKREKRSGAFTPYDLQLFLPSKQHILLKHPCDFAALSKLMEDCIKNGLPIIAISHNGSDICTAIRKRSLSPMTQLLWTRFLNHCNVNGHAVAITRFERNNRSPEKSKIYLYDQGRPQEQRHITLQQLAKEFLAIETGTL